MKRFLLLLSIFALSAAHAQSTQGVMPQIFITEIMYNPPESGTDSLEFIEIYNNSEFDVDLSGYQFTAGVLYTFPAGSSLAAGQYKVIAVDSAAFVGFYGFSPLGEYTQALNNTPGDSLVLTDGFDNIMDAVKYGIADPWPAGTPSPAGGGPSIQYCDWVQDNADGLSWEACNVAVTGGVANGLVGGVQVYATPGKDCSGTIVEPNAVAEVLANSVKLAPNPVEDNMVIYNTGNKQLSMQVYDATGKLVMANVAMAGNTSLSVAHLSSGLYVARFNESNSNSSFAVKFLKK